MSWKVCRGCGVDFLGAGKSQLCPPCRVLQVQQQQDSWLWIALYVALGIILGLLVAKMVGAL